MSKKLLMIAIAILMISVPAMADVNVNVTWNNPTPTVNVSWVCAGGAPWAGASGYASVGYEPTAIGIAAEGQVTFSTIADAQPSVTNWAQFQGGTYRATVDYLLGTTENYSYAELQLTGINMGAVSQGVQAAPVNPVNATTTIGGQNLCAQNATGVVMEQIVSGSGYARFFGFAHGNVVGDATQTIDPSQAGSPAGLGVELAGDTGTTYFAFELAGGVPGPGTTFPLTTVVVGKTFSGTDPWGMPYGPTNPAFSAVGETTNVVGFGWIPGYIP